MARVSDCHPEKKHRAKGLCQKCYDAQRIAKRREYKHKYGIKWRAEHPDYDREQATKWRAKYPEYARENSAKWRAQNLEYSRKYMREYAIRRKTRDVQFKLACTLRRRLGNAIKGNFKNGSAVRDLGCSIGQFKLYIENQFEPGMSWDNYGKWHLDHVQPLTSFDLTDRPQFSTACNWLNYQPLWAIDNLSKGNKCA